MFLEPDGAEIDWIAGYRPPPEKYQEQVDNVLRGVGTFKNLSDRYAKDPANVETIYALAGKYETRNKPEKATELYKQVIALDPDGKKGTTVFQNEKVTFTQAAEFALAAAAMSTRPPDPAPLRALAKKYGGSPISRQAYSRMSPYYQRSATKEEAAQFYEEYTAKFPQDPEAFGAWAGRILSDKGPYEKGIELALRAVDLMKKSVEKTKEIPRSNAYQVLADLYLAAGDKSKAAETADRMIQFASSLPGTAEGAASPAVMAAPAAAQIFVQAGQAEKALSVFGPEFIKKNMGNAAILGRYAQFWSSQGQNLESALEAAKKAAELAPANFPVWGTLSEIYMKQKNYGDALKAAEKALQTAPDQPPQLRDSIKKRIEEIKAAQEKK